MPRSCSPICCFRSRRWAWGCATRPGRSSTGICAARADLARLQRRRRARRAHDISGRGARAAARAAAGRRCADRLRRRPVYALRLCGRRLARGLCARAASTGSTTACTRASTSACASCWPPTWRCRREAGADCVAIFDTAAGTLEPGAVRAHGGAAPLAAVVRGVSRALPAHAGDLLLARYRTRALGGAARHRSAVPGHRLAARSGRGAARAGAIAGACRATSIRSGCCCRRRSSRRGCARCSRACWQLPAALRAGWVCGLGHGVLQHTPEDNVRLVLEGAAGDVRVNAVLADPLVAKYDVAGPRYTSYPTVPYWETTPSEAQWIERIAQRARRRRRARRGALPAHSVLPRAVHLLRLQYPHHAQPQLRRRPTSQALLAELDLYLRRARVARSSNSASCTSAAARRPS